MFPSQSSYTDDITVYVLDQEVYDTTHHIEYHELTTSEFIRDVYAATYKGLEICLMAGDRTTINDYADEADPDDPYPWHALGCGFSKMLSCFNSIDSGGGPSGSVAMLFANPYPDNNGVQTTLMCLSLPNGAPSIDISFSD